MKKKLIPSPGEGCSPEKALGTGELCEVAMSGYSLFFCTFATIGMVFSFPVGLTLPRGAAMSKPLD